MSDRIDLSRLRTEADFAALSGADVARMEAQEGLSLATELPNVQSWTPPGKVADAFFWSDADVIGIRGPVGSGKTTTHFRSRLRRAKAMPRSCITGKRHYKLVIARETYRQLWATTIPSWWESFPKTLGTWSGGRGDPVTHKMNFEDEFGEVEFITEFIAFGQSPAEIEANIRGVQTTDLGLEEADTVAVAVLTKGIGRIDRYPSKEHFAHLPPELRSYGQVSASYNACDPDRWPVRVIEGRDDETDIEGTAARKTLDEMGIEIKFFRQPGFGEKDENGNPAHENRQNLSEKYYPRQIAAITAEGRGNDVERLVYNKLGFVRVGDPVFRDMFDPLKHVADRPLKPIPGLPLRIGLDQGYFGAATIWQFLPPFQWRCLGELWFKDGSFAPEFGRALRQLLRERFPGFSVEQAWSDPAGNTKESLEGVTWRNQIEAASHLSIDEQHLGGNRIEPRLAVWRAAMQWDQLGQQGLLIDPGCKLLIRGLENDYVWTQEVDKAENKRRIPKKKGCRAADVIDSGGYVMLSESLADGRPKTAELVGGRGGASLGDEHSLMLPDQGPAVDDYDFDGRGDWSFDERGAW